MARKLPNHAFAALDTVRRETGADLAFSLNRRRLQEVEVARVRPNPQQPRRLFREEELEALAASIRRYGLQQPILVRACPEEPDGWELVAGERRLRACQRLGRTHIEAILTSGASDEVALLENLQRVDLSPFELAAGLAALSTDKSYSHEDLGILCGRHRSEVTRLLGLTRLETEIRDEYEARGGDIPVSVLFLLAETPDPAVRGMMWEKAKAGAPIRVLRAARTGTETAPSAPASSRGLTRALRTFERTLSALPPGETLTQTQREHLERLRDHIAVLLSPTAPSSEGPSASE